MPPPPATSTATAVRPSVGHVVGRTLAELGVDTVFGLLGSGNIVVTNALNAGGARVLTARHEAGAVCMADAWARVTGRVGVASVHQGPGLTNTPTALGEAAKSRTPLLVLCGETPAAALRSNFRIDQHDLVRSVGAVPERIYSAESAATDAARALRRAEVERVPVVLMLPIDLQAEAAPDAAPPAPAPAIPAPSNPGPAAAAIRRAAELVAAAERPLIVGGRGAVLADARADLEALGERIGALLATSAPAHGLFAGLPYDLGMSGGFSTPLAAELLPQADLVLAFGATLNGWTTRHGQLLHPDATLVQVDLEPDAIGANRPVTLGVLGDVAATARALEAELERIGAGGQGLRTPGLAQAIAASRWRDQPYEDEGTEDWIDPRTLSVRLAELLPTELTVAIDSGHFMGYPAMYLDVPDARSWLFGNAFQAVGLGLGAGIGAAVARPDRVTVAAIGDGGAFMALPELETAARLRLRLLVVIYDDAAYGAEVHHFRDLGEELSLVRFPDADLAGVARAFGAEAITVRGTDDLAPVERWLERGTGPLVVDAKVNPHVCAEWLEEAFRAG
jgi:thiamine pyrophosphate-dependent acetolactate synthase large subunit-like protein